MANDKRKEKEIVSLSEFQKDIIKMLEDKGINNPKIENVKLTKININNYYGLTYNAMSTGIRFDEKEINESEWIREGIGIWRTCSYVW